MTYLRCNIPCTCTRSYGNTKLSPSISMDSFSDKSYGAINKEKSFEIFDNGFKNVFFFLFTFACLLKLISFTRTAVRTIVYRERRRNRHEFNISFGTVNFISWYKRGFRTKYVKRFHGIFLYFYVRTYFHLL